MLEMGTILDHVATVNGIDVFHVEVEDAPKIEGIKDPNTGIQVIQFNL